MFLLIPDHLGSPGRRAVKWLVVVVLTIAAAAIAVTVVVSTISMSLMVNSSSNISFIS